MSILQMNRQSLKMCTTNAMICYVLESMMCYFVTVTVMPGIEEDLIMYEVILLFAFPFVL